MYKIYTQDLCGYCTIAKQILRREKIEFEEINISKDHKGKFFFLQQRHRTVPQIYNEDKHIGDCSTLIEKYGR